MTRDPHKILGLKPGASHEEIRGAYLRMVKKYHPDVGGDAWVFSEIQAAYEALTNQKPPAGTADRQPGQPTSKSQPRGESPHGRERDQPRQSKSSSTSKASTGKASTGTQADAKPSPDAARDHPPGATIDEFSFPTMGTGRRPRRRRASAVATMFCVALGGLMALSLGWYLMRTRPDLLAFLRGDQKSPVDDSDNSANQARADSPQRDSMPGSNDSPADQDTTIKEKDGATSKQSPSKGPVPKPNLSARPNQVPNVSNGASGSTGARPSDPEHAEAIDNSRSANSSPPPAPANSDSPEQPKPTPPDDGDSVGSSERPTKTGPESTDGDPAQPTGIESLDADILEFDRRLAAAQREPTELKRQTELDDAVAWMERNCKRARVRFKFQITDIRRGEADGYVVQLGPPDPGNYPRLMSYPKIAEMNLDEDDALRVGEQYRLEVTGYTGFQWGTLDPSAAIVFYASECPLAPVQPGAAYGPNFGAFPTDYVYLAKDSLHPAYWILLKEAELRIVKARD